MLVPRIALWAFSLDSDLIPGLHTCRKAEWWHDGANPASLLWGAFKFFLKNHKENCKSLGHPQNKHVDLNESRRSPSQGAAEGLQLLGVPIPQLASTYRSYSLYFMGWSSPKSFSEHFTWVSPWIITRLWSKCVTVVLVTRKLLKRAGAGVEIWTQINPYSTVLWH